VKGSRISARTGRVVRIVAAGAAVVLAASVTSMTPLMSVPPAAAAPTCGPPTAGAPMFVTDDCVDPRFNQPFVDVDEMRTSPVPHRYVHGGFTGTDARFSFYFPAADQYDGRFFQGPTHQLTLSENLGDSNIAFAIDSGAYAVQTNMGGIEAARTSEDVLFNGKDAAVVGYRVNAAAAKFSRVKAAEIYGDHRPFGYLHGGSGGAFQTISALENTTVYDGGVPFVLGSENAIPNVYTARIHALRILRAGNKLPGIVDAIDPGGSGDPLAGLNQEEREAFLEVTRLGFPPRGWWSHATMAAGALPLVAGYVPYLDPNYTDDFWTMPGYLGHDDPFGSLAAARIIHEATVVEKLTGPNRLRLDTFPGGDLTAIDLRVLSGAGTGVGQIGLPLGFVRAPAINAGQRTVTISAAAAQIYNAVQVGDRVALDNSGYLALQTYHRHQIGSPEQGFYTFDQFRHPDGTPIYPQRDVLVGPVGQFNGSGGHMTGRINGKMIVLESLMDIDAFPFGADEYRTKVRRAMGKRFDDTFRVYFQDHAQHGQPVGNAANARTVAYTGALQQALRDVAAWAEDGVKPPASTRYDVVDGQVEVPGKAGPRKGIQPVVELKVNGGVRADVAVGQTVTFSATIQAPPKGGQVVGAEWDFLGVGDYPDDAQIGEPASKVELTASFNYAQPGTYFPVLRAASQREGDAATAFARIENIARVRVVVT
jgi:hypothetical protein